MFIISRISFRINLFKLLSGFVCFRYYWITCLWREANGRHIIKNKGTITEWNCIIKCTRPLSLYDRTKSNSTFSSLKGSGTDFRRQNGLIETSFTSNPFLLGVEYYFLSPELLKKKVHIGYHTLCFNYNAFV